MATCFTLSLRAEALKKKDKQAEDERQSAEGPILSFHLELFGACV